MTTDNYASYKEERDLILEYNQVGLDDARVENILGVGVDNLTRAQAIVRILRMIEQGGVHHILLLNPFKLMRIRLSGDLSVISNQADMRLASGAGIGCASAILKRKLKERIPTLSFMMDIIRIAEIKEYSIFIVGGRPEITERVYNNIKKSFPDIRIVGRHGGYFNETREKSVIEAMRKSEANIIFVGLGFPKEDKWIGKIRNEFSNTVFVGVGGYLDVISGEIRKAPNFFMERDLDWFYRILIRPWRIHRLIMVGFFYTQALLKRLFRRV